MTEESLKRNLVHIQTLVSAFGISDVTFTACFVLTCMYWYVCSCLSVWRIWFIFKLYAAFSRILASSGLARLLRDSFQVL